MSDSDILKEAKEAWKEAEERENENRESFKKDVRFARLEEQWPTASSDDARSYGFDDQTRLTINMLAPIIRQVVNDARQNKPAITVRPQDNDADPETAEIMTGLIRNIEQSSDADIAYDTAVDNAVSGGFGYFGINLRYACDDNWEQDIVIERMSNPLAVRGDPDSMAADSSDWNRCLVADRMRKDKYEREYPKASNAHWDSADLPAGWTEGDKVTVAAFWKRQEVKRKLIVLKNPVTGEVQTIRREDMKVHGEDLYMAGFTEIMQSREVMSYDVKRYLVNGVEVLETVDWKGKYIPIVPVYGDEIVLEGERYFRSLIHPAIDASRMFNYWASKATRVVALAPRNPYIGPLGAFVDGDHSWDSVNDEDVPYLEYDPAKGPPPQRQPFAGVPAGMLQEMMNCAEHIKKVTGIYDASLGARSNETSGVAIRNRQMEGDTSTFHFIDNLSRAIRHGGRILIDLIPKVYNTERIIRVLGEDGKGKAVPLGQPVPVTDKDGNPVMQQGQDPMTGQPIMQPVTRIYDLTLGKYDLAVEAGPSFTSRREETRTEIVEVIRAVPESAAILGPMYLRNSDWPGAAEAADKMEQATQGQGQEGSVDPEIQKRMTESVQRAQQLEAENAQLKMDQAVKMAELEIKNREMGVKEFEAETRRMEVLKPEPAPVQPQDQRFAA